MMNHLGNELTASELMKRILEIRFDDEEEVLQLCERLLSLAESKNDIYGTAFANVYLLDAHYVLGNYEACRFYLLHAQSLCETNGYDDLLLTLHNIAGLYYQYMFDEQSAISHYLQGLQLARKLANPLLESKLFNNMGICFHRRYDNAMAARYFHLAYETLEPHIPNLGFQDLSNAVSFLCNYAESCQYLKKAEESEKALRQAEALHMDCQYNQYHLAYAWCGHYTMCGDRERSIAIASKLLEDGLEKYEHLHFKTAASMEMCGHMLNINCQELALRFLQLLESCCGYHNVGDFYHCQILRIRYNEAFGTEEECLESYEVFYEISMKMNETDNAMNVQNALSKIQLTTALLDREEMRRENKELENSSHIDELTQLYNRRYLSKLISKVLLGQKKTSIGFIMLDVDYFKQYNDFYGHFKGDGALKCVAGILKARACDGAYAGRYGGDEFLVLCVNWSDGQMEEYVQQIRMDLEARQVPHEKSLCSSQLTLSIGCSNGLVIDKRTPDIQLELADQALYEAKRQGRNSYYMK